MQAVIHRKEANILSRDQLLYRLRQLGVQLRTLEGQLVIQAPKGALTPSLREALATHKAWLLSTLAGSTATTLPTDPNSALADRIRQRLHALPGVLHVDVDDDAEDGWRVQALVDGVATGCTEAVNPSADEQHRLDLRWRSLTEGGAALVSKLRSEQAEDLVEHAQVCNALNQLSTIAMARTLLQIGAFRSSTIGETADSIVRVGALQSRHGVLMRQWLHTLAAAGYLNRQAEVYHPTPSLDREHLDSRFATLQRAIHTTGPYARFVDHIKTCAGKQVELLRGQEDPFALLFPGGCFDVAQAHYRDNPVVRINNAVLAGVCRMVLEHRQGRSDAPTVLEIGAGTGATTDAVLAQLPPSAAVRYIFTDVGDFFLRRASQRFSGSARAQMVYRPLDLVRSPLTQGFHTQSVDVLIGVNVVHNARHVEKALSYLRSLLKPGGVLLLSEQTENVPLNQINFAHFESYGHYQDRRLRLDSPLMPVEEWRRACLAAGFTRFAALSNARPNEPDMTRQRLLVAEAPASHHQWQAQRWMEGARSALHDFDTPIHLAAVLNDSDTFPAAVTRSSTMTLGSNR